MVGSLCLVLPFFLEHVDSWRSHLVLIHASLGIKIWLGVDHFGGVGPSDDHLGTFRVDNFPLNLEGRVIERSHLGLGQNYTDLFSRQFCGVLGCFRRQVKRKFKPRCRLVFRQQFEGRP